MIDPALLLLAIQLKELPRAGWLRVGIEAPESVAAHSWGIAWLAMLLCPPELDRGRVLAMAALHDLPEVIVGDITPCDGISPQDKHRREALAAAQLLEHHPALLAIWQEYTDNRTAEANLVHQLDKLDMAIQAIRYTQSCGADTREFITSAAAQLSAAQRALISALLPETQQATEEADGR